MTKVIWDETGSRLYELGVDRGVFYPTTGPGVAWNGLSSVSETTEDTGETTQFIDGNKYINTLYTGTFAATLSAFTYPDEFEEYNGMFDDGVTYQQSKNFNLSYRSLIGNDIDSNDHGYKIHLVYNAIVSPSVANYTSYGYDVTPLTFSWDISTTPTAIPNAKPTSHIIIDTTKAYHVIVSKIEDILYGTNTTAPRFPTISEVIDIFDVYSLFRITDHGDGSFTAYSPEDNVKLLEPTVFQLSSTSVFMLDVDTYQASTL